MRTTKQITPMLALVGLLALQGPAIAQADGAGNSGGGYEAPTGEVFDFYEGRLKDQFPRAKAYALAMDRLKVIQQIVPVFATDLESSLERREWYTVRGPLRNVKPLKSFVDGDGKPIAGQNEWEIDLSLDWMEAHTVDDQARLIIHEMVRFVFESRKVYNENGMLEVTRMIYEDPLKTPANEFAASLVRKGLPSYQTQAEIQVLESIGRNVIEWENKHLCGAIPTSQHWQGNAQIQQAYYQRIRTLAIYVRDTESTILKAAPSQTGITWATKSAIGNDRALNHIQAWRGFLPPEYWVAPAGVTQETRALLLDMAKRAGYSPYDEGKVRSYCSDLSKNK